MTEMGLTAQQIFDWWMTNEEGWSEKEWSEKRDTSVQTINERVNEAEKILEED